MISFGGDLKPKVLKAKGEIYYGYMLVLDYANGKVYPGVLLGFELEAEVPHTLSVTLKAEAIGLVKRLNAAEVW